jgi:hypothetical protein
VERGGGLYVSEEEKEAEEGGADGVTPVPKHFIVSTESFIPSGFDSDWEKYIQREPIRIGDILDNMRDEGMDVPDMGPIEDMTGHVVSASITFGGATNEEKPPPSSGSGNTNLKSD